MNASTITVHWHDDNQPIYSATFQPGVEGSRLVTGGGDNNIRIWSINHKHIETSQSNGQVQPNTNVEYLSTLRKHTQAVNIVRFNKAGTLLASAGDDGTVMIWQMSNQIIRDFESQGDNEEDDDVKESWRVILQLRSSMSEINDICWSPNDEYIVTGSMDNTLRIYQLDFQDISNHRLNGKLVYTFKNHSHYIQGVTWDPQNDFIASQSSDRSVVIYKIIHAPDGTIKDVKYSNKLLKYNNHFMYYPETLQSFFRRLNFSPDGSLLITPCGIEEVSNTSTAITSSNSIKNSVYIYSRKSLGNSPIFKLSGLNKPATAISFNPKLYKLHPTELSSPKLSMPYKMVFAVATQDSVVIYDTINFKPLGYICNMHYSYITDVAWDPTGETIIVSSTDGFCSIVSFDKGAFGDPYVAQPEPVKGENEVSDEAKEEEKNKVTIQDTNIDVGEVVDIDMKEEKEITPDTESNKENSIEEAPSTVKTIDQFFVKVAADDVKKDKSKRRIVPTLIT
ncbi:WD40-repeat-containing domain protein [Scheffersomyces amazonensis]|uniref:WD40-repeat-containing domain protein n=1 Tax=Scheffersomyces amazonensis TaxID=1078765 RepID=UPI00315D571C